MKKQRTFFLFVGDIVALVASFFITLKIGFLGDFSVSIIKSHIAPFLIIYLIWLVILFLFDLYDITSVKPTIPHLQRISMALIACLAISAIFFYTIPIFDITPKTNLVINIASFSVFFIVWRRIFYEIFTSRFKNKTIIISKKYKQISEKLASYITEHPQSGMQLLGFYEDFDACLSKHSTDDIEIIITSEPLPQDQILIKAIYGSEIEIIDLTTAYEKILFRIPVETIDTTWLLHNLSNIRNKMYELTKSVIGYFVSATVLLATSPISIIIMLVIKIQDGGKIFIRQKRVGKNGIVFDFYKFRSMIMLREDGQAETDKAIWSPGEKDSRITPFGQIIRKLHVDEIPQLFNVLKGDMNLVGPRPERPEFVQQLENEIPHYHLRHIIKPGFTGWAQIKFRYGRTIMDAQEKFEYDLYYIKNKNVFMDLGIILRTIQIIFTH